MKKYVAFLRGINVGGHHKVPMADLRKEMEKLHFKKVVTLLNSGNIVFEATAGDLATREKKISAHLEKGFGFPIPTLLRTADSINELLASDPFKDVMLTKDIRLYVSFLRDNPKTDIELPWISDDSSFRITHIKDKIVISILDLSITNTPKGMEAFERLFGKEITTRNWNTIKRIEKKLEAG